MSKTTHHTVNGFTLETTVNPTHKHERLDTNPENNFIINMTCTDRRTMRIYNSRLASTTLPSVHELFKYKLDVAKSMVSTTPADISADGENAQVKYKINMFGVDDTVLFELPPLVEEGDRDVNELRRVNQVMQNKIKELKADNTQLKVQLNNVLSAIKQLRLDHRADIRTLHNEIDAVSVLVKAIQIYMNCKKQPLHHFNNLTYWTPSGTHSDSQATKNIRYNVDMSLFKLLNAVRIPAVNYHSKHNAYGVPKPGSQPSLFGGKPLRAFACEQDLIDRWAPFTVDPKVFRRKSLMAIVLAYSQVEKHRDACQKDIDEKKEE